MSEKNPPTGPTNTTAAKGTASASAAVIRKLDAARETSHERLMKKHLPAWVISGAVNVGVIALGILLFGARTAATKQPEKVVATSLEKEDVPPDQDLTNEDRGVQSDLEAVTDVDRVDKQTLEAVVTTDPIGQPNANESTPNAYKPPGVAPSDQPNGAPGDDGSFAPGAGGESGIMDGAMAGRSGATKSRLLRDGGGSRDSELAVGRGLAWLARQQRQDGAWVYDAGSKEELIAATGMALLPFLAAGETHRKNGGKYQKNVLGGLGFLIKNCPLSGPNAGKFNGAGSMYAQAIGAMALCEAYGMTRDKSFLLYPAQAAINYIQKAQAGNGSWGYAAGNPGDTSIVGWQIQALKAAILSKDVIVNDAVIKNANKFLDLAGSGSRKSAYGYNDNAGAAPGTALTAVGLLSRYYVSGWGPDNGGMAEGVLGLMKHAPVATKASPDTYYFYYATQVVHFFEGDEWKTWNEGPKQADGSRKGGMRDWLIDLQLKKDGVNLGSWDPEGGWIGRSCGRLGTTAMCLLTLEVYYRHLPLYKRANQGDAIKIIDAGK